MFCESCGVKIEDINGNFCHNCGTPLKKEVNNVVAPEKKKKKTGCLITGIILGVVGIFVLAIAAIVIFALSMIKQYQTMDYVEFDNDKVATVYEAIGEKNLDSYNVTYNNNDKVVTMGYDEDEFTNKEIENYVKYLQSEEFYVIDDNNYVFILVKESEENGKLLFVYSNFIDDELEITYSKEIGKLEDYRIKQKVEEGMQEIGNEYYGYIHIPNDWVVYEEEDDDEDLLSYSSKDKKNIITLDYTVSTQYSLETYASYMALEYEEDGASVLVDTVSVDGFPAYTLTIYYKDHQYDEKIWLFTDDYGYIHYVSLLSYEENEEIFYYINTYYLY